MSLKNYKSEAYSLGSCFGIIKRNLSDNRLNNVRDTWSICIYHAINSKLTYALALYYFLKHDLTRSFGFESDGVRSSVCCGWSMIVD